MCVNAVLRAGLKLFVYLDLERGGENVNRNISQAGNIFKQFHKARLDQAQRQVRGGGCF